MAATRIERHLVLAAACAVGAALAGCAGSNAAPRSVSDQTRAALQSYLRQVEPIRLAVNRLLDGADPILEANRAHRISPAHAARRMGALERRFAAYTIDIESIVPATPALRSLAGPYAHTYILEDAYLSALVSGLAERDLGDLPHTQAAQRATIIAWRIGLSVLARRLGVTLPADLAQAGRGEIAPSPSGS